MVLIYLDAGHGGKDSGATGNNLKEKDINLSICNRIKKGLSAYDCTVKMTRSMDAFIPLEQRTTRANQDNADILVSIHVNSAGSNYAKGFESFIYPNSRSATVAFQNVMHQEIIKAMGTTILDRGKKTKNLHMLRETKMKAILTENLFISNSSDARLLEEPDFLQRIADGHISGLVKFLGLKKNEKISPPKETSKSWTVQVGYFEDEKMQMI